MDPDILSQTDYKLAVIDRDMSITKLSVNQGYVLSFVFASLSAGRGRFQFPPTSSPRFKSHVVIISSAG